MVWQSYGDGVTKTETIGDMAWLLLPYSKDAQKKKKLYLIYLSRGYDKLTTGKD
jgi:hypothetical protein